MQTYTLFKSVGDSAELVVVCKNLTQTHLTLILNGVRAVDSDTYFYYTKEKTEDSGYNAGQVTVGA